MKLTKFAIFQTAFILGGLCMLNSALAKNLPLYDQPKSDAKIVGQIDGSIGIVPIFTNQAGDWMKVGDPRNGNVGWIKASDMSTPGTPSSVTFTQKMIQDNKGVPRTYQVMQFGQPREPTPAEVQKMMLEQQKAQENLQKAVDDAVVQFNKLTQQQFQSFKVNLPVFVAPKGTSPQPAQSTPKSVPQVQPDTTKK